MRRWAMAGTLVLAGLGVAAPNLKDRPNPDPPIVGTWRLVTAVGADSVLGTAAFWADGTATLSYTHSFETGTARTDTGYRYTTDPKGGRLDLSTAGDGGPRACLYRIQGDRLTISYRTAGGGRPKTLAEDGTTQEVWERVRPKD